MGPSTKSPPAIGHGALADLLQPLTELVAAAGRAILKVDRSRMKIDGKTDGSPVTEADLAADCVIAEGLKRLAPEIPSLSEERAGAFAQNCGETFFLIDPLDGTKEFVAGRDEFTVNLALVVSGVPRLGIIGAPALGFIWRGIIGHGAERLTSGQKLGAPQAIRTRKLAKPGQAWIAAVSRSHGDAATEAFIDKRPNAIRKKLGSAVKFARVAEGAADIYPRLAPTSEWDVAAGFAIVTSAGGKITQPEGADFRFGSAASNFIVPAFIAWGDPDAS